MTYEKARKSVIRERETEKSLRSKDWSEIVERIHELENAVEELEKALEKDSDEWYEKLLWGTNPSKREWVGLTDDEVYKAVPNLPWHYISFARAIEAKLKEKNT